MHKKLAKFIYMNKKGIHLPKDRKADSRLLVKYKKDEPFRR